MWYRPSQFAFYWFFKKKKKKKKKKDRFWGHVNLGNLPTIPLLEDPQSIEHMTSRGDCFNFTTFRSTNLSGLRRCSPSAYVLMSYSTLLWEILGGVDCAVLWARDWDKGLHRTRTRHWTLVRRYLGSEKRARKPIQTPVLCLIGLGHLFCQTLDGLWREADSSREHNQNRLEIMLNESQARRLTFLKGTDNKHYSLHEKQKGIQ